jgi:hypothetical protein
VCNRHNHCINSEDLTSYTAITNEGMAPTVCVLDYVTPLIGLITGTFIGIFAEPIRTRLFRPRLKVSFESADRSCKVQTPMGAAGEHRGIYIRAKVQNTKSQMAKACRAFLVKIEKQSTHGTFEPTIFADSLPLAWSCQKDGSKPVDLFSGVSQFVDVISTTNVDPTAYQIHLFTHPHRYAELFDREPKTLRLTILVTGDGASAGQTAIVFKWGGQWDTFEVGSA